ncbi:MAG: pilus assembly protein [Eubacteriales bacterium]|nr:pilus assembly protein [Eubacteriales bacterium]
MLFGKYDNLYFYPLAWILKRKILKIRRSLQAQATAWLQKRKRASRFASCEGTATVEAVLVFPIFLSALCALLLMGQLLMTEAKIQFALSKTAEVRAAQEAVKQAGKETGNEGEASGGVWNSVLQRAQVTVLFSDFYDVSPMDKNCIQGGRRGILLSDVSEGEMVEVRAAYCLKVELPFFGVHVVPRRSVGRQRIFMGYTEHGEGDGGEEGTLVYVTEHGSVYHTSLSCSHICLKIAGDSAKKILSEGKYHACEKCIEQGKTPSSFYITVYGEKYHSSLKCSGLKRTVKTVRKEEIGGLKLCSRCGARIGGE